MIGCPAERLPDEGRQHHAVLPGLPRPDRVEQPHDHDRQLPLLPVGEREELVEQLAAGVGPAVLDGRAEHQLGAFAEGHVRALAVHLRRGGEHDQLLLLVRVLEHDLGAVHVRLDRVHRPFDDQLHADGGGQMEDDVAAVDPLGEQRLVVDGVDHVREAGALLRCEMFSMDPVDRLSMTPTSWPRCEQSFGEVRSDEPGTSRDQGFHRRRAVLSRMRRSLRATRATSASASRGCSGSDSSSAAAAEATGHSTGSNAAKACWADSGTG